MQHRRDFPGLEAAFFQGTGTDKSRNRETSNINGEIKERKSVTGVKKGKLGKRK